MIIGAVRQILLNTPEVTDIVGTRIHPYNLPMGATIPAIDMRVIVSNTFGNLGGTSGLFISQIVLDCYSKESPKQSDQIAAAILSPRNGVIGYQGVSDDVSIRDIQIQEGITNDQDGIDPASEEFRHVSSISLDVTWAQHCRPN
jgi:hypothetical protein